MAQSPAHGIGYMLIGLYINLILFGVTICQLWLLWTRFVRDPWGLKLVVTLVFAAEISNTVCACIAMSGWLVDHYGQPEYLTVIGPAYIGSMQSGAISAFIVQCFLAWRIHCLRHQWWLTAIIVFFACGGLIGSIATMIGCGILESFGRLYVIQASILVWSACIVVCDSMETIALYATLRRALTGFASTDTRIVELKNLILQTSVLTMICDLCHLSLVAAQPDDQLHLLFNLISPKLVSNALLSTLNTRRNHQQELLGQETTGQFTSSGGKSTFASWRRKLGVSSWLHGSRNGHSNDEKTETVNSYAMPSILPHSPRHTSIPVGQTSNTLAGAIHVTTVQEQCATPGLEHASVREQNSFHFTCEALKPKVSDNGSPLQSKEEEEEASIRLNSARPNPSRDPYTPSHSPGDMA